MTNEEKQIEEMAKVIDELLVDKPTEITYHALNEATYLYDNGYRKASDVAREIFGDLEAMFNGDGFHYFIAMPIFDELKKKYESEDTE